jgi:hypothetical protein
VLRVLLRQVASQLNALPHSVFRLWDEYGLRGKSPDLERLLGVLVKITSAFSRVNICLDGLDQICEEFRPSIVVILERLIRAENIALLVTARPFTLTELKDSCPHVVDFKANEADLHAFAKWRLKGSRHLQSRPALQEKILGNLLQVADGS